MHGMTLKEFLQTMTNYDEIEFSYKDVQYDFQKEKADDGKIKISVWQGGANSPCYCVEVENNLSAFRKVAENIIDAKILFDGKSIAEVEKFIDVEFFT